MTADDFNQSLLDENANSRATDLTKREHIAALALQGLLASGITRPKISARMAVDITDALLEELSK